MEDSHFLRKAKITPLLDEDDTPLLVLLRGLFIEAEAPFCVKGLAAELGVSVYAVYKMFAADRPLRAETLLAIVRHIGQRDHRLLDLICAEAGYVPMPEDVLQNRKAIRELLEHADRLTKEG